MELYELRYFCAVAEQESVSRAAQLLRVSAPALSKAVARLEEEFGASFFERVGRNIRLTEAGRRFQKGARTLLDRADDLHLSLRADTTSFQVVVAGREVLLGRYGMLLAEVARDLFPRVQVLFRECDGQSALRLLERRTAHFAVTVQPTPARFRGHRLDGVDFDVAVGSKHPLRRRLKKGGTVALATLLEHGFVSPQAPILGRTGTRSIDGWPDDRHPRRVDFVAESLHLYRALIREGRAIAYLPRFLREEFGAVRVELGKSDPGTCMPVYLTASGYEELSWVTRVYDEACARLEADSRQ